jgi:cytochrome c553
MRGAGLAARALGMALMGVASMSAGAAPTPAERVALCSGCHGEGGRSTMALTPSLAGQPSFYAITQLFLFRDGRRANEAMSAVAKTMSDDDLRFFSDWIGKLPPPEPAPATAADAARVAHGAALAKQHLCASCHGADYAGGQQVPRLAHQREDYLAQALAEFKAGKRVGYTPAMSEALARIDAKDLPDLAHYLSHLPAAK